MAPKELVQRWKGNGLAASRTIFIGKQSSLLGHGQVCGLLPPHLYNMADSAAAPSLYDIPEEAHHAPVTPVPPVPVVAEKPKASKSKRKRDDGVDAGPALKKIKTEPETEEASTPVVMAVPAEVVPEVGSVIPTDIGVSQYVAAQADGSYIPSELCHKHATPISVLMLPDTEDDHKRLLTYFRADDMDRYLKEGHDPHGLRFGVLGLFLRGLVMQSYPSFPHFLSAQGFPLQTIENISSKRLCCDFCHDSLAVHKDHATTYRAIDTSALRLAFEDDAATTEAVLSITGCHTFFLDWMVACETHRSHLEYAACLFRNVFKTCDSCHRFVAGKGQRSCTTDGCNSGICFECDRISKGRCRLCQLIVMPSSE
jgi:hypothetical protein